MPTTVIGLLGPTLDAGMGKKRWNKWRPTVALCTHEDFAVDRFELIHQPRFFRLAELVADDIREVSPDTDVVLHPLEIRDPWDLEQTYAALHDFARGYSFRRGTDYFINITTGTHIAQIVMFLLTEARFWPGRLLQVSPPPKTAKGGPGTYRVIDLDLSQYDAIARRFAQEQREGLSFLKSGIDTRNAEFNRLIEQIERVAISSRDPMLLTGPTGAGKSRLARKIYELKRARRQIDGALVDVNCATIRGDGAMSALFGHIKGAFTGAGAARAGYLKQADGGVLFLDEIGELGLDEQAMLLRAIEDKTFFPVGADKQTRSDFQLIAGTNRDLGAAVTQGRFRDDLLARINLWTYRLPGLRERREDIEPNLDYELGALDLALHKHVTMTREARSRFLEFAAGPDARWAGNFRDLNAAVRRMATLCDGGRIGARDVSGEIDRLRTTWRGAATGPGGHPRVDRYLPDTELDLFDRAQLEAVLEVCESARSMADAGRQLFAASRAAKKSSNDSDRVRKYLARFGLAWSDIGAQSAN